VQPAVRQTHCEWRYFHLNTNHYPKYYPTFSKFKKAILECVYGANEEHKEKLDSLLTLKFQSFKKVNIINY